MRTKVVTCILSWFASCHIIDSDERFWLGEALFCELYPQVSGFDICLCAGKELERKYSGE